MTHASLTKTLEITNQRGLHARAAAKFVKVCGQFQSTITVSKGGMDVCGTSIMGLLLLAASIGTTIEVQASGNDAEQALISLEELVLAKFYEE